MKTLVRLYSASCLIVIGFFVFFSIPWGLLPFSDGVDVMVVGGLVIAAAGAIFFYMARGNGFDFGWFLAHGGFWVIVAMVFGGLTPLCGTLLTVSPELFVPVLEQGALPIGMLIVSLFWMALTFAFGFLAFVLLSAAAAPILKLKLKASIGGLAIGSFCLLLTGVFFTLYLDVVNDNLVRIPEGFRSKSVWGFASILAAASVAYGLFTDEARADK